MRLLSVSVRSLLRIVISATPKGGRLFPYHSQAFRDRFYDARDALGLNEHKFVLHSFGHAYGGATDLVSRGKDVKDITYRGRWQSDTSAKRYMQHGKAEHIKLSIPKQVAAAAAVLAKHPLLALVNASSFFLRHSQKHSSSYIVK